MGWLPQAVKRDVGAPSNFSNGPMRSYTGIVLHVNDANSGDLFGWITGNGSMSCHFQVLKDGTIYQYIDTAYSSWCQADGNNDYLSIETQGFPAEPLTDQQVASCAAIVGFVNAEHGIPLQIADSLGDRGLGWHGMGGAGWGGHFGCPGDLRKTQRAQILTLASGQAPHSDPSTPVQEDDMPYIICDKANTARAAIVCGGTAVTVEDGETITVYRTVLNVKTLKLPTADYNRQVAGFQK